MHQRRTLWYAPCSRCVVVSPHAAHTCTALPTAMSVWQARVLQIEPPELYVRQVLLVPHGCTIAVHVHMRSHMQS